MSLCTPEIIMSVLLTFLKSHGAMENWGLITYRTTAVLFDEANSDTKYKNRVAYVVAHGTSPHSSPCSWLTSILC